MATKRRTTKPATAKPSANHATKRSTAHAGARRSGPARRSGSQSSSSAVATTAEAIGRTLGQATAAIAERLPWGGHPDGLDLLERDHRRLEELLEQGTETSARSVARRTSLLRALSKELATHELMEEKVLYPVLKAYAEAKEIVLEGYQEHHVADVVLQELHDLPPSDERWGAKLKVLKENIEHHIEEEEGEMFKTARSVLSRAQLEEIGARMQALKEHAPTRRGRSRA
jgi:hemerythrin-like domain-containing protein